MVTIAKTKQPVRMPRFGHRVDKTDPIMRGCVGWWPLNDGAGTKAKDLVGGNDGTLSGGVTWANSPIGTAAEFDKLSTIITASLPSIDGYPLSVSCWFRWDTQTGRPNLFSLQSTTETEIFSDVTNSDRLTFTSINSDAVLTTGDIYHMTGVFESLTSRKLYINGVLDSSSTATLTGYGSSYTTLEIGDALNGKTWDGLIQNLRIYTRALSATEVSRLYTEPWAGLEPLSPFSFFSVPTAGAPLAVFYNHYKNQGII